MQNESGAVGSPSRKFKEPSNSSQAPLMSLFMGKNASHAYVFGPFRLDPAERILTRDGAVISLTGKAFDALLLLVQNSGKILDKQELLNKIWPDSFVEEGNLSQNIFLVRKALGDETTAARYIETVPKRGYRFIATVTETRADRSHT